MKYLKKCLVYVRILVSAHWLHASSQIVGTQAVFNVIMGERYKWVTKETKAVLSGEYGATVKPFNPEVQKKCIGDKQHMSFLQIL